MKLLHDFFRLHLAGPLTAVARDGAPVSGFRVTVPAPLAPPAADAARTAHEAVTTIRREPASFLKTSRHHRRGVRRG